MQYQPVPDRHDMHFMQECAGCNRLADHYVCESCDRHVPPAVVNGISRGTGLPPQLVEYIILGHILDHEMNGLDPRDIRFSTVLIDCAVQALDIGRF